MIQVVFTDAGITHDSHALTQYDYNQKIQIHGLQIAGEPQIHFARKGMEAIVKIPEVEEGTGDIIASIPNSILQYDGELTVYIYSVEASTGRTLKSISFYVKSRERPEDYVLQEDDAVTLSDEFIAENTPGKSLEDRVKYIEDVVIKLTLSGLGAL